MCICKTGVNTTASTLNSGKPKNALPSGSLMHISRVLLDLFPASICGASGPHSRKTRLLPCGDREVMGGRYIMHMGKSDIMGEGSHSVCRRGTTKDGKTQVAIKVYKDQATKGEVTLQKFRRQIAVLKDLMEPLRRPKDASLLHPSLEKVRPQRIFVQLLDYSRTAEGLPGPDASDGVLYVVTELAQYSLKDYLAQRREQCKPLSAGEVRSTAKAIVTAMAGLHAKGYVHMDMKPENLMFFNGRWKIIDLDGCVRANSKISIQDSSMSFSLCYCAPEWARFLIEDGRTHITANPALDVWSVGMTLCELVTMGPAMRPRYARALQYASSSVEADFLFMEWLGGLRKSPAPKSVGKHDEALAELIERWLLVPSRSSRKTCAQALSSPYIMSSEDEEDMAVQQNDQPVCGLRSCPAVLSKPGVDGDREDARRSIGRSATW